MLFYRLMCLYMPEYHARCLSAFPDLVLFFVLLFLSVCALYYVSPLQQTCPLDKRLNQMIRWIDGVLFK